MNVVRNFFNKQGVKIINSVRRPNKYLSSWYRFSKSNLRFFLSGAFFGSNFHREEKNLKKIHQKEDDALLKTSCRNAEYNVCDFMKRIAESLKGTCQKYRQCIIRQVEILNYDLFVEKDQIKKELLRNRVEAEALRSQFKKYQSLIEHVEQIVFNLALCSATIGNLDSKLSICDGYYSLQKINFEQMNLNKVCEERLLQLDVKYFIKI